tara:strand:+ start:26845 stop:27669 length:825 start_codon:yes stop_codon:yes gene_type:complete
MTSSDYYSIYYPRNDLWTGNPLPFKNYKQYFSSDFLNKRTMRAWCEKSDPKLVQDFMIKALKERVEDKGLKYAPSHLCLETSNMPTVDNYEKVFGSYEEACKRVGVEPLFPKLTKLEMKEYKGRVFVDSREQNPLSFLNSEVEKIDVGDYLLVDEYDYTYVDRKSFEDFRSTVSSGFDRFCEEIERAVSMNSYLFVVVESEIQKSEKNYGWKKKIAPLSFTYSRMREITNKYPRRVQFVFSEDRESSQLIIPELLRRGRELWECDIQRSINGLV